MWKKKFQKKKNFKCFSKVLNFGPIAVKFWWKRIPGVKKKIQKKFKFFSFFKFFWCEIKNPEFWSHRGKILVKKNYTPEMKKKIKKNSNFSLFLISFTKVLNFGPIAVKFWWKKIALLMWKKKFQKKKNFKCFSKVLNFGPIAVKFWWKRIPGVKKKIQKKFKFFSFFKFFWCEIKNPEFWSHRGKILVKKNYTPEIKKNFKKIQIFLFFLISFTKVLNFGPIVVKFWWKK